MNSNADYVVARCSEGAEAYRSVAAHNGPSGNPLSDRHYTRPMGLKSLLLRTLTLEALFDTVQFGALKGGFVDRKRTARLDILCYADAEQSREMGGKRRALCDDYVNRASRLSSSSSV